MNYLISLVYQRLLFQHGILEEPIQQLIQYPQLRIFFDVSTDYLLTGTEKSSPTENLSENELEMLEVFQKFNEREQLKLIGKLEELLRQKQIKENQQPAAFKVARSSDGQFRKTELSAEELERIHNLPEDTDF